MTGEGMLGIDSCLVENDQYENLKCYVARLLNTAPVTTVICTGLKKVIAVAASLDDDPTDAKVHASASIGDQAGSPAAGSVYVKLWKLTSGTDPTPTAASDTGVAITVCAIGQ